MKAGSDVYALRSGGHSPPLSKNTVYDRLCIKITDPKAGNQSKGFLQLLMRLLVINKFKSKKKINTKEKKTHLSS